MNKRRIVALIVLGLSAFTRADAPPVLDAKALVEKSIEAAGGKEKLLAVKSMSIAGKLSMPAQGIEGTLALYRAPGKALITVEIPNVMTMRSGFVGDIAYESSDMMGARLLNDAEKRRLLDGMDPQAQFDRLTGMKDIKIASEMLGDVPVLKLSGTGPDGDPESHWIDAKTYHTLKSQLVIHNQMGKIPAVIEFSDFKTIEGITLATTMKQEAMAASMIATLSDIKINPVIPDATFAIPAEVQKLVDKQPKKPAATQPVNP